MLGQQRSGTNAHGAGVNNVSGCAEIEFAMTSRLFVGNLSFGTTSDALEALFASFGEVREVAIPTDRTTGQPRGFAFITMNNAKSAEEAISQLNGHNLDGRPIKVDAAQERPRPSGGGGGRDRY